LGCATNVTQVASGHNTAFRLKLPTPSHIMHDAVKRF
jgi:hypothetical protein